MIILFVLIYIPLGLLMLGCIIAMFRNNSVYKYRTNLLNRISDAARVDIENLSAWSWRYDEFDQATYDEMVLKFWRKPSSFYPQDPTRTDK